jgi:hypothetical protein
MLSGGEPQVWVGDVLGSTFVTPETEREREREREREQAAPRRATFTKSEERGRSGGEQCKRD